MSTDSEYSKNPKNLSQRQIAVRILDSVLIDGAYPDLAIRNELSRHKLREQSQISFINEIVFGVVRWKLKIDYLIEDNISKKIKKEKIKNLLRIGVYQLEFMDGVKEHASINETVELGKHLFGKSIGNFINAVLRSIQRKGYTKIKFNDKAVELSINESFPQWIIDYWLKRYSFEKVEKLCRSQNKVADPIIRTNNLKTDQDSLITQFSENEIAAKKSKFSKSGIVLLNRINPHLTEFYKEGLYSIQDEAAQLVSFLLDPKPNEKVLDACAAPGGKSTHLAELMKNEGEVFSCDINKNRLRLVKNQVKRLGTSIVKTECLDLSNSNQLKKYENYFDKILVDAPCSGLGTIRRNPDIKWTRKIANIKELSELQYEILSNVSFCLKRDGILVYSVCTLSEFENEKVIDKFLKNNPDFELEEIENSVNIEKQFIENKYFISYTDIFNMDCFFAARLKKIK